MRQDILRTLAMTVLAPAHTNVLSLLIFLDLLLLSSCDVGLVSLGTQELSLIVIYCLTVQYLLFKLESNPVSKVCRYEKMRLFALVYVN